MLGLRRLLDVGVPVSVISVITDLSPASFRSFQSFTEGLLTLGVKNHSACVVCDAGRARTKWKDLSIGKFRKFAEAMQSLVSQLAAHGYHLSFNDGIVHGRSKPESLLLYFFEDAVPGWKCLVRANGDVILHRVMRPDVILGSVRRGRLAEVWDASLSIRRDYVRDVYQRLRAGTLANLYYRFGEISSSQWSWLSALDRWDWMTKEPSR